MKFCSIYKNNREALSIPSLFICALYLEQQTVRELAAGEDIAGKVFPVPLPKNVHVVLPDLDTTPLPDVGLVLGLVEVEGALIVEQNKLSLAASMLDMQVLEERQLFCHYEDEVKTRRRQLLDAWAQLQGRARVEDCDEASREWQCLWTEAATMVERLVGVDSVSASETQQFPVGLSSLELLIDEYLNRKYLG